MKNIKLIVTLFLMFALPVASFAGRGHGSTPPRPAHHGSYHGHSRPAHHGYHGHHGHYRPHYYHGYYYGRNYYYTRDAFWTFLGFSALTAAAVAASNSSKRKKEKVIVVEKEAEQEDLTLTAAQQTKLQKLFDDNRDYIAKLRSEKDLKTTALEKERNKAKPDEATIAGLENEISQLSMNIFRVTQNTKKQIQTILTPAQYEEYEDVRL